MQLIIEEVSARALGELNACQSDRCTLRHPCISHEEQGSVQTCADLGLPGTGGRLRGPAHSRRNGTAAPDLQPSPQLKHCTGIKINAVLTPKQALLS